MFHYIFLTRCMIKKKVINGLRMIEEVRYDANKVRYEEMHCTKLLNVADIQLSLNLYFIVLAFTRYCSAITLSFHKPCNLHRFFLRNISDVNVYKKYLQWQNVHNIYIYIVCVRACVRACVCVCTIRRKNVCVCVCVCVYVSIYTRTYNIYFILFLSILIIDFRKIFYK